MLLMIFIFTFGCETNNNMSQSESSSIPNSTSQGLYFSEVPDAFPEAIEKYWFFDKDKKYDSISASVLAATSIDINNDGKKEFMMVFQPMIGRAGRIQEPCMTTTAVYELVNGKFEDASDKYLEKSRDFQACVDFTTAIVDINGDGKPDVFFSANQEDGRSKLAGSLMVSPLVGWVSKPNGKYEIVRYGQSLWYHSIGAGIDSDGKPFVIGGGFSSDGRYPFQNTRYQWRNEGLSPIIDRTFPGISPTTFIFQSTKNNVSDVLIQLTYDKPVGAAEAYIKTKTGWSRLNSVGLPVKEIGKAGFTNWFGEKKTISIYDYEGTKIVGGGIDGLCNLRLYKDKPPVAAAVVYISRLNNYTPNQEVKETENKNFVVTYSIKNNRLVLNKLEVRGEEYFSGFGKMQCIDVNDDGYDDIVLDLGWDMSVFVPRIYINNHNGIFYKLDLSSTKPMYQEIDTMYFSHMDDFDNDGIIDSIVYSSYGNSSMPPRIKFFKGDRKISQH